MLVGDRDEQRVDGHRGLAGADVRLQQTLHRPFARQVAADGGDRLVLVGGQLEREEPADVRVDRLGGDELRRVLPIAHRPAAQRQRHLEHEEFLVDEAPPAREPLREHLREVDVPQRLRRRRETALHADCRRHQVGHMLRPTGERLPDDRPQLIGTQPLRERIDGHDLRLRCGAVAVERLHARAVHLPVIAKPARLAAERDALAVAELAGRPNLVEPAPLDAPAMLVGDDDAEHPAAIV